MKLLLDDYNQVYVWVDDLNEDDHLSPCFDYEQDALQWANRVKTELNKMGNTQ